MDHNTLLELTSELGYRLAMSGAETFRVEESINRILAAYGVNSEVFAIPNCLIVSIETDNGESITRMRRIGFHGNDLDSVERYSNLSRKICAEKPVPSAAMALLHEAIKATHTYKPLPYLIGGFLAALGYCIFFGGTAIDVFCAGICGIIVVLANKFFDRLKVNQFFSTIAATFLFTFVAYSFGAVDLANYTDTIIIGTLMILVPGLLFVNAMRDIIFGDTNSGVNRIVQVVLIAAALALGTGAAWSLTQMLWGTPLTQSALPYSPLMQCFGCFIAGVGFSVLNNIHGIGSLLCTLGGSITWASYCVSYHFSENEILSYFIAAVIAAIYAEIMARVRKYPAISYLVISVYPLLPGAGIYYASNYIAQGEMTNFASTALKTSAIAGSIAVGILMISTTVRLWTVFRQRSTERKRTQC